MSKTTVKKDHARLKEVLRNWRTLMAGMTTLDEKDAYWCLQHEIANGRRPAFVDRLYGRFSKLRQLRERRELMSDLYS